MQTTLLGVAIAVIVAIVTALIAPLFIDWSAYRDTFEQEASRAIGVPVRIAGAIDVRLLPTPILTLQDVDVGGDRPMHIRRLAIDGSLGSLVRGELHASETHIEGVALTLNLGPTGQIGLPLVLPGGGANQFAIDHLSIDDGRVTLIHAASGTEFVLDQFWFKGEVRSLAGAIRGEGSFYLGSQHYPYRIATSPDPGDEGAIRLRLTLDPIARAMTVIDGNVSTRNGAPYFDGAVTVSKPVGLAGREGAASLITDPWKLSAKVRGDLKAVTLEQAEFQYGPDDHPIRLKGDGRATFGDHPRLEAALSAAQVDFDRVLALPDETNGRPAVAIKTLLDHFSRVQKLPLPLKLNVSIDAATLAGVTLQRLRGDLTSKADAWDIDNLEFRAPGLTQVVLSGQLQNAGSGVVFAGRTIVDSADPRSFLAWLADSDPSGSAATGPLSVDGEMVLGGGRIVVDHLKAEIDHVAVEGKLAYTWKTPKQPARLDATLRAAELDFDRIAPLWRMLRRDFAFDQPGEGALSIAFDKGTIGGVEASGVDVQMQLDTKGFVIERLAIGDFGGAKVAGKGRIDTALSPPQGSVDVDIDASKLDGVTAILSAFSPHAAALLKRNAAQLAPAKLHAVLDINGDPARPVGAGAVARFNLDGRLGTVDVKLDGDGRAPSRAFTLGGLSGLGATYVRARGEIKSIDGAIIPALLGLDGAVAVAPQPGQLRFAANGPLDGALKVDGDITANGLNATANGTLRLIAAEAPSADLMLAANGNVRPLSADDAETAPLPAKLSTRVRWSGDVLTFDNLLGSLGGAAINGRLQLRPGSSPTVDGELDVERAELVALIAPSVGWPQHAPHDDASAWSGEPFGPSALDTVSGRIKLKIGQAELMPNLVAQQFRADAEFGPTRITLTDVDGRLGGGKISGQLEFERSDEGVRTRGVLALADVEAATLFAGSEQAPITGRLKLNLTVQGAGRSPVALFGSLNGAGTFVLDDSRLAALDAKAFVGVAHAADQGLPIDQQRVGDWIAKALANGSLAVRHAEGAVTVNGGQMRLANFAAQAEGVGLAVTGGVKFTEASLDARLILTDASRLAGPDGERATLTVLLNGDIAKPRRTLDVAALTSWLALRAVQQQVDELQAAEKRAGRLKQIEGEMDKAIGATDPARAAASPQPSPASGQTPTMLAFPRATAPTTPTKPVAKPPAVQSAAAAPIIPAPRPAPVLAPLIEIPGTPIAAQPAEAQSRNPPLAILRPPPTPPHANVNGRRSLLDSLVGTQN